ncbi:MAG: hypothetical protein KH900_13265 [[Clostridium] symbiosum]|uniref:HNH endonuclease n=1 Tax=Clostridium symbiosum TaxID=1512 RepID=UPI00241F9A82|nr:hypothetical protein [[Clostridium] symbiosum]
MKEYCIYCGKEIINQKRASNNKDYSQVFKSSEHIIQNALGGKLESEKICCDRCNYHMEKLVDKKFCVLFAALTSKIEGLKKTNNTNSKPVYSGYAIYSNEDTKKLVQAEVIKKSNVKKSQELIDIEKHNGLDNLDNRLRNAIKNTKVLFNDFKLENEIFKQGLSKIAFSYAIHSGIEKKYLDNSFNVKLGGDHDELVEIKFNTKVIPYYPGNEFDKYIELNTDFQLTHNLILFSYCQQLWCYIDLFNTFQYYVLLSNDYKCRDEFRYYIYNEDYQYMQTDANTLYKSYKEFIWSKAQTYSQYRSKNKMSYNFYINEDGVCSYYRLENPLEYYGEGRYQFILYPLWIIQALNQSDISKYTTTKFVRLNQYLIKDNPWLTDKDFENISDVDMEKIYDLWLNSHNPKTSEN